MEYIPETAQEVVRTLSMYYSIGLSIEEEYATIETCHKEAEACAIVLPPLNLSGLPGGKGTTGDKTADTALTDRGRYYRDAIQECYSTIALLQAKRDWAFHALESLSGTDRRIIELRLVGPRNTRERARWRPKTYQEIAEMLHYSKAQVYNRYRGSLLALTKRKSEAKD